MTSNELTFTWRRYLSEGDLSRRKWVMPVSSAVLLALAALSFALEAPGAGVFFLAWASIPIAYYSPRRARVRVTEDGVEIRRQFFYANTWLWMTVVSIVAGMAALAQIYLGDAQAWRLILPGVGSLSLGTYFAMKSHRARGPLLLVDYVIMDKLGFRIRLNSSQIEAVPPERGGPSVRILPVDKNFPSASGYLLPPRDLGLDLNTLASTLDQLVVWSAADRHPHPAEIAAMLTAAPPQGISVGDSVDLTLAVAPRTLAQ